MGQPYEVEYADEAAADIRALRVYDQRKILTGIESHLMREPRKQSKSRIKAMAQPFWSQYRLRIGDFRVYYDVSDDPRAVHVLRVLTKTTGQTSESST